MKMQASEIPDFSDFPSEEQALISRLFDEIAAFSQDTEGVSRPAYSELETKTLDYLERFALAQGLVVSHDRVQNFVFSLPQDADAKKFVLIGSHVDTVPQGGNFDGLAGVLSGLLCLLRAKTAGLQFARPVKVIAMRGEESAWFGPCYIASKSLLGCLSAQERQSLHKGDGRTLDAHMEAIGVDMAPVRSIKPLIDPESLLAYIELHIEQGPLLIEKNIPAAVVSGIRGNFRYKNIQCIGEAGHSGAVPRALRRDPVLAMADLLVRLDESWLTILQKGSDLVLTSGVVATNPARHALTRIPDRVGFSLDVRSQNSEVLDDMRELLQNELKTIGNERKVKFELGEELSTKPALCDEGVVSGLSNAMKKVGQEVFVMASGGGHDAAVFANAGVPTGMIFVRNQNGSHNPDESMEVIDFIAATDIIYRYLLDVF